MKISLIIILLFALSIFSSAQTGSTERASSFSLQLRLFGDPSEKVEQTHFCAGETVYFSVTALNRGPKHLSLRARDQMLRYQPELILNGRVYPYLENAKQRINKATEDEKNSQWYSGPTTQILANEPKKLAILPLYDWYGALETGTYEIIVNFSLEGKTIKSDPVAFEVAACNE